MQLARSVVDSQVPSVNIPVGHREAASAAPEAPRGAPEAPGEARGTSCHSTPRGCLGTVPSTSRGP